MRFSSLGMRVSRRQKAWLIVAIQLLALVMHGTALANPFGAAVVAGSASVSSNGSTLTINQATNRAIINWQGFSISPGELTQILQPGSSSAILNRVTGGNPSALLGTLQSSGQVFLINPNGILVGPGAQINVGGFTASTLDIDNAQFMRGGDLVFRGDSRASVINRGNITALEGNLFLIGANVENHGTLTASSGTVGLAAGQEVKLVDSAHQHLVVKATSASIGGTGVANSGMIDAVRAELAANGGNVYALAINNTGTVRATGSVTQNGRVLLTASGGKIAASGDLIAKNSDGSGGTVHVLGDEVRLAGAKIDVSGADGGGVALVGGDYQGANPAIANAQAVYVDDATTINADATLLGNGGKVIVWSDGHTEFAGTITARGGADGGDGGFAEVSGKQTLNYTGLANLNAPLGSTGTLLLDPTDFPIGAAQAAAITASLAGANVVVATDAAGAQDGEVAINAPILYASANDFAILAHGDILANASVQNDGTGAVSLVAGWDGVTEAPGGSGINSPAAFNFANILADSGSFGNAKLGGGNGSIFIGDGTQAAEIAVGSRFGASNFAGAAMTIQGSNTTMNAFAQAGFRADTTMAGFNINGPITVALSDGAGNSGDLTAAGGGFENAYAQLGHGGNEGDGDFAGAIMVAANNISFTGGSANDTYAHLGHGGDNADGSHSGAITVNADGNLTFMGSTGDDAYAQLGHGGNGLDGGASGDIMVSGNNFTFTGGSNNDTYAQLGHGGDDADGTLSGTIMVTATGNLSFNGGGDVDAFAQLGHGGVGADGSQTGGINITQANNIVFTGGTASTTYAQLGHGGAFVAADQTGEIRITQANDLTFAGNSAFGAYAQLGHGGLFAFGNQPMSDITITQANNLTFTGGSNFAAYAQLGHGGDFVFGNQSGVITLGQANNLLFMGGAGFESYAQLGHGGAGVEGDQMGNIDIVRANLLTFLGGSEELAYAQLGHGGAALFTENEVGFGLTLSNQTGNITARASDAIFVGGTAMRSYSQLGHGDASGIGGGMRTGDVTVILDGSALLVGTSPTSPALFGHATSTPLGISGNLTLAIDQINPIADNGGRLFMNSLSAIDMGGAPNQVRIFGTRRLGNVLADGAVINGIVVDSGLPIGTTAAGRWNPNTEFISWDHEQWGPTLGLYTLASPGPYTSPFTFFYLGVDTPDTSLVFDRFGRGAAIEWVFYLFPNGPTSARLANHPSGPKTNWRAIHDHNSAGGDRIHAIFTSFVVIAFMRFLRRSYWPHLCDLHVVRSDRIYAVPPPFVVTAFYAVLPLRTVG